ncbi:DUF3077 domain-containing protein [Pseudomonas putida]|uniref:DUF3077 domain-containing protein n=1 Tax=Pseudomonas putida TaxID=303 RepID=UPI0008193337|nr:DUF3077 domain-containing protein [Pseudomonas putida]OCT29490.1 hypothetical protein A6E20_03490 [Pseudomonas putida]OCT31186.1 hypothetical protein A6E23_01245 [Pseudomonas putida]OCT33428.1 hypothetical protein A6E24_00430 [Pseudomonas putida]OCT39874.1 hypothetical protein A6E19_00435 [Pseudomonas putida]
MGHFGAPSSDPLSLSTHAPHPRRPSHEDLVVQCYEYLVCALTVAQSSLSCVDHLTDLAMVEGDDAGTLSCAAHSLSGMSKALVQDVSHGLMQQALEIDC